MKISVIIPVYNVEKYLSQCLDSVINQTYKDLEIICIDDCSTDLSYEILKEYAKKDNRIKIFQNETNIYAGRTRNRGLELATGDYIHFLDSDDWLELNAYEILINYLKKMPELDVLHFACRNVNMLTGYKEEYKYYDFCPTNVMTNVNDLPEIAYGWLCVPWCKIYNKKFMEENNFRFLDFPFMEDGEFSIHVLAKAQNVYLAKDILVNYRQNQATSLTGKNFPDYRYSLKSYYLNIEHSKNLSKRAQACILENELFILLGNLYNSFMAEFINRQKLLEIINNLDYSMFQGDKTQYKWYVYYHDLTAKSEFILKLTYRFRIFLKLRMPKIHAFLVKLRSKFKFLRKI